MKEKFKIGDIVEVVDTWECYSTYEEWINKYGSRYKKHWKFNYEIVDAKTDYKILAKGKHEFLEEMCYLIQNTKTKQVFIIGEKGIELVEDIIEYKGKKYDVIDKINRHYICSEAEFPPRKSVVEEYDELILTLQEHKEEILDEEEKKYLSAVIKPFRDEVEYICRNARYNGTLKKGGYSYISIKCKNDEDFCYRSGLPIFETDTMYKGMELDKEYTLDQLGL